MYSYKYPMPDVLETLTDYFKDHHLDKINNEDCFCHLKGDTSSVEKWFEDNFDKINFEFYFQNFGVWRQCLLEKNHLLEIIENNETLSKINKTLKIAQLSIMEISKNSWVSWHYDTPRRGPVINLLLTPYAKSHSLFTHHIFDTSNLVECIYNPHQFCLYNTEIIHSVLNFDNPRYVLSVTFEKGNIDLTWNEAKNELSSIGVI